jgi:hypothetical protein
VAFYMCKQCTNMKFTDYHKYKNHIVVVHQRMMKQDNVCEKCFVTFSSVNELNQHYREDVHLSKHCKEKSYILHIH